MDGTARPPWQADALCRDHPELVFVPSAGKIAVEALDLCRSCLVRRECLTFALQRPATVGCWGGTTTGERATARSSGLDVDELVAHVDRPVPS